MILAYLLLDASRHIVSLSQTVCEFEYMRLNESTAIVTPKVVLVPYRRGHVEKYNQWMQSPELRELTASEPLTLEEEYEMQESWRNDEDKLTFIVLARGAEINGNTPNILTKTDIDSLPMIGDVNLFLKASEIESETEGEIEVMIAEPSYRRQGFAACSISALMHYVMRHGIYIAQPQKVSSINSGVRDGCAASTLVVRIGQSNVASISLFQKLGFTITKEANIFGEIEMRFIGDVDEGSTKWGEPGMEVHYV